MPLRRSPITWTDYSGSDANFVLRGRDYHDCEVSPGCAHCYAASILRRSGLTAQTTTFYIAKLNRLVKSTFDPGDTPYRRGVGSRPLVFVVDMGDLFHEDITEGQIRSVLTKLASRSDVDWQILTKRAERLAAWGQTFRPWPANIWAGVSVENQAMANLRIPLLLQVPARVRFLSMEPLLESVDLTQIFNLQGPVNVLARTSVFAPAINWVIVGGESGPKRRPFEKLWACRLRDQCFDAGVPFFFKQGSALHPGLEDGLEGRFWKQFPV